MMMLSMPLLALLLNMFNAPLGMTALMGMVVPMFIMHHIEA